VENGRHTPKSPCIRGSMENSPIARGFRGVLSLSLAVLESDTQIPKDPDLSSGELAERKAKAALLAL
jgi:hypothetical protein